MSRWQNRSVLGGIAMAAMLMLIGCGKSESGKSASSGVDPKVTTLGTIEVTAKLAEIPEGAIFERDLYDYATILKYDIVQVHRGQMSAKTIYVGQYNPFKPRAKAADQRVQGIGGDLKKFEAGQVQRMALEVPIDDHFMGGIVNKYFGQETGPIYWAVWTNLASE